MEIFLFLFYYKALEFQKGLELSSLMEQDRDQGRGYGNSLPTQESSAANLAGNLTKPWPGWISKMQSPFLSNLLLCLPMENRCLSLPVLISETPGLQALLNGEAAPNPLNHIPYARRS